MVKMNNKCQKFGNSENMLFKIKTFNNSVMHFVAYKMKKRVGFFFMELMWCGIYTVAHSIKRIFFMNMKIYSHSSVNIKMYSHSEKEQQAPEVRKNANSMLFKIKTSLYAVMQFVADKILFFFKMELTYCRAGGQTMILYCCYGDSGISASKS